MGGHGAPPGGGRPAAPFINPRGSGGRAGGFANQLGATPPPEADAGADAGDSPSPAAGPPQSDQDPWKSGGEWSALRQVQVRVADTNPPRLHFACCLDVEKRKAFVNKLADLGASSGRGLPQRPSLLDKVQAGVQVLTSMALANLKSLILDFASGTTSYRSLPRPATEGRGFLPPRTASLLTVSDCEREIKYCAWYVAQGLPSEPPWPSITSYLSGDAVQSLQLQGGQHGRRAAQKRSREPREDEQARDIQPRPRQARTATAAATGHIVFGRGNNGAAAEVQWSAPAILEFGEIVREVMQCGAEGGLHAPHRQHLLATNEVRRDGTLVPEGTDRLQLLKNKLLDSQNHSNLLYYQRGHQPGTERPDNALVDYIQKRFNSIKKQVDAWFRQVIRDWRSGDSTQVLVSMTQDPQYFQAVKYWYNMCTEMGTMPVIDDPTIRTEVQASLLCNDCSLLHDLEALVPANLWGQALPRVIPRNSARAEDDLAVPVQELQFVQSRGVQHLFSLISAASAITTSLLHTHSERYSGGGGGGGDLLHNAEVLCQYNLEVLQKAAELVHGSPNTSLARLRQSGDDRNATSRSSTPSQHNNV